MLPRTPRIVFVVLLCLVSACAAQTGDAEWTQQDKSIGWPITILCDRECTILLWVLASTGTGAIVLLETNEKTGVSKYLITQPTRADIERIKAGGGKLIGPVSASLNGSVASANMDDILADLVNRAIAEHRRYGNPRAYDTCWFLKELIEQTFAKADEKPTVASIDAAYESLADQINHRCPPNYKPSFGIPLPNRDESKRKATQ